MWLWARSQWTLLPDILIEKWKKSVDKGKTFAALLTDLSKAFDCLPYDINLMLMDLVYQLQG